jgi:hypothetical protein
MHGVRVLVILVAIALASAAAPHAFAAELDGRVFTVAGGGTKAPRDGLAATDARLTADIAALVPDGTIVVAESFNPRAWRIDLAGRLHPLPPLPNLADIDAERDGSLLGVAGGAPGRVLRLRPGDAAWAPLPAHVAVPLTKDGLASVAAAADGGVLAVGSGRVWRMDGNGNVLATSRLPADEIGQREYGEIVARTGGGFAAVSTTGAGIVVAGGDGRAGAPFGPFGDAASLAPLADGGLLIAQAGLSVLGPAAKTPARLGLFPGRGFGDGAGLAAAVTSATRVDTDPGQGTVLFDAFGETKLDRGASHVRGALVPQLLDTEGTEVVVRVIVPASSLRPLLALTPATYGSFARGEVAYSTTFAGRAELTVRRGARVVARLTQDVPAGDGVLRLPRRLARADYRLELRLTGGATEVTDRLALTTRTTLGRRRALRLARLVADQGSAGGDAGGGSFDVPRGCRPRGNRTFRCRYVRVVYSGDRSRSRCLGLFFVRLRADGARAYRRFGPSRCPRRRR